MGKVLMYVDAENVSRNQVNLMLDKMRMDMHEDDEFIGKCYGSRSTLSSSIHYFLTQGFEFVETGILSTTKKNLADMKIIVDSLCDVLKTHLGDVNAVYILSNDSDFNPLIYKLNALGVRVVASAFETFDEIVDASDLARYLYVKKIYPIKASNAVSVFYEVVKQVTSHTKVSEEVIIEYLSSRYERLRRFICSKLSLEYTELTVDEVKQYSFYKYNSWMHRLGHKDSQDNFRVYTQKVFGSELTKNEMETVLSKNK